jgi:pseudaminic acid biosynthesis-associated methylase
MTTKKSVAGEAARLEQLWAGEFGDAYVDRNRRAGDVRQAFWRDLLAECSPARVLEVGCNVGANLRWIAESVGPRQTYGVDINSKALDELRAGVPGVNALYAPARSLPFRDRWFDLVFTMGVLIHQPEDSLALVMAEIVRTSRRWVLCGEYHAEERVEIAYRGQNGALFKRDYGRIYRDLFPELRLARQGFLGREQGWDDITWWLFEVR